VARFFERKDVKLPIASQVALPFVLQIASLTETVNVTEQAPLVDTTRRRRQDADRLPENRVAAADQKATTKPRRPTKTHEENQFFFVILRELRDFVVTVVVFRTCDAA
jgi:hypothetical protein